ncbi:GvpL/GvpF family gas vesicle protein [uncultured Thiohalocapsa sp.]|uniref:GvpL/GvpF family gas vesicle protein n=1 Tax=uncultured Thiohalocapsa sp. TaxID=768990 RepID=UPI0025D19BF2|nr:GvpL/GvpF family gas vesicle protein [uncultured Thiohalocapsa sp.]
MSAAGSAAQADGAARDDAMALYLYCFAPADAAGLPPEAPAVDGGGLSVHRHAGLTALVSPVRRADYEGEQGVANLADIGWVGPRALRHQTVLDAALAATTVFPLPFATLFSSVAVLEAEMASRRTDILAALDRLAGCAEWAVQGQLDRARALDARVAEAIAAGRFVPPAAAGRRHLEEQRLRRALTPDLEAWAARRAAALADALRPQCRGLVERRIPSGQALAFNWALLVPDAARAAVEEVLTAAAPELAECGLTLEFKGPWPGYSFTGGTP